jgi:hypothetical protein
MAFQIVRNRFSIHREYGQIWPLVLELPILLSSIPQLVVEEQWKNWFFYNKKLSFVVNTNDVYHKLVDNRF